MTQESRRKHVLDESAHWHHLANIAERSMHCTCSNAALCKITLTTSYCYHHHYNQYNLQASTKIVTCSILEEKYSLESTDPRESEIRAPPQPLLYLMPIPPNTPFLQQKNYHSLFVARTWQHFIDLLKRKNPRFTAFLDSNLHTRLAIVTENELGLAFPPRNLPKNFVQTRPRFI